MSTPEQLNRLQRSYMNEDARLKDREAIHQSWFDEGTTDFWRHRRMYETIGPLAAFYKKENWLTVGDGRFGLDAIRLKRIFQLEQVFPTDISENMLRISMDKGYINSYGVENAEQLSFGNDAFDIVFCKEAFHHFPRPYLALYEMLRVSKKAVVMIEPAERLVNNGVKSKSYLKSALRLIIAKLTGKKYEPYIPPLLDLSHSFEDAGNYLYAVSIRELEKLVHGLALGAMVSFRFNDDYRPGCEFEKAEPGNPLLEAIREAVKTGDELYEKYPQSHQPNMVTVIIFKEKPDPELAANLKQAGYHIHPIHENPHAQV